MDEEISRYRNWKSPSTKTDFLSKSAMEKDLVFAIIDFFHIKYGLKFMAQSGFHQTAP